jgi:hypothetical protein
MKKWQAFLLTAFILALLAVVIWLGWKPLMGQLGVQGELIQSADSLISILAAIGSMAFVIFSFFSASRTKSDFPDSTPGTNINTRGGANIGGGVDTHGGDYTDRDKNAVRTGDDSLVIVGNVEIRIYIGNLPKSTTPDEIRALFAQEGEVTSVTLVKDRDSGLSKGFAFVTMTSQESAEKAISKYNSYSLAGNELKVNIAQPRVERAKTNK